MVPTKTATEWRFIFQKDGYDEEMSMMLIVMMLVTDSDDGDDSSLDDDDDADDAADDGGGGCHQKFRKTYRVIKSVCNCGHSCC